MAGAHHVSIKVRVVGYKDNHERMKSVLFFNCWFLEKEREREDTHWEDSHSVEVVNERLPSFSGIAS
jgi:hypothetical protein